MTTKSLSAALMAAGLFLAAPAFAQSTPQTPPKKQQTQEGAPAIPTTANDYKQRTRKGLPPFRRRRTTTSRSNRDGSGSIPVVNKLPGWACVGHGRRVILVER